MAGSKISVKGEIVLEYVKKYPHRSKRNIAKILVDKYPAIFKSIEVARRHILQLTKAAGHKSRESTRTFVEHNSGHTRGNQYGIPLSESDITEPYIFDKVRRKVGMISDLQFPYHCERSLDVTFNHFKKIGINTLYINGDFFDFYQGSNFVRDPRNRDMAGEIHGGKEFLHKLFKAFKGCKFYFKEGNHEERWKRYLMINAPMILDMEEFQLEVILELRKFGCEWIKSKQLLKMGKLNVLHGHEVGCGTLYPAKGLFNRIRDNGIIGHHHQITQYSPKGISHSYTTFSTGAMCTLSPEFSMHNEWRNGFAVIYLDGTGDFMVENKGIIRNKIY